MNARTRSRIAASASRPTPASVPTAPFTTLEKSSKKRFCDCMAILLKMSRSAQLIFYGNSISTGRIKLDDTPVYHGRKAQPCEIGHHCRSEEHTSELQSLMRIS